ncbi:MAG: Pvc16 family protein [Capsulimonas sp.]|uniref:Pvc16 family protein n=1 Tax=Capsulimonas sp. TaxID=2494211 RepID=UPI00326454A4
MIQDVDETLSRLLAGELVKIPGCPVRSAEQITFDSPQVAEATLDGEAHVNLFLRDVRENMERREEGFYRVTQRADKSVGVRRPPVHFDLSYLITVYAGDDPLAEHRLLSNVLGVLLRCSPVPEQWLAGTLTGKGPNTLPTEVALPEHAVGVDLPGMWQALGGKMRAALSLLVTYPFDPFETKWTIAVREAVLGMGQGTMSEGPAQPRDLSEIRVSAAGVVLRQDTETPISGVEIRIDGYPQAIETDGNGFFWVSNLTPGVHNLHFTKYGYRPHEADVVSPPGGSPFQLEPAVIAMRAIDDSSQSAPA